MKFTIPFIKGNISHGDEEIKQEMDYNNIDFMPHSPAYDNYYQEYQGSPSKSESPPPLQANQFCSVTMDNKRSLESDEHESYSENSRSKREKLEEMEDAQQESNKLFLLSLIPDMNEMTPSQVRKFKRNVICCIQEILEGTSK